MNILVDIRRVSDALKQLEMLTSCRQPPAHVQQLRNELRAALDSYMGSIDAAAE